MLKTDNSIFTDIKKRAKQIPNHPAIIFNKKKISYKELNQTISNLSDYLKDKNIKNIFIKMENSYALINSIYAVTKLKKNLILSNLENNFEDDFEFIKEKKIDCLIVEKNFYTKIKKKIDIKKKVILYKEKNIQLFIVFFNCTKNLLSFRNKIIIFSSGTTQNKKNIILSHSSLNYVTQKMKKTMKIKEGILEMIFLPITQSFAFARMRYVFSLGGCILLEKNNVRLDLIIKQIIENKVNTIGFTSGVVLILNKFYKNLFLSTKNFLKQIEIGSDYLSNKEKKFLIKNFINTKKFYHYGLTEASRSTLQNLDNLNDLENCGKKFCSSNIIIKKKANEKVGEILVKGKNLFEGYIGKKKINKNKYFSTGDFGYMKNNKLYFSGRKDDIVNFGGRKVSCKEINKILDEIKEVSENSVISIKSNSEIFKKKIVSFVILKNKKYKSIVLKKIYKIRPKILIPKSIYFLKKIPKTSTGKVKRAELIKIIKNYEQK